MEGFGGAPRFLAYPRAFTVQSGTNAVLSCQIMGDPQPSILWEKDKNAIEPSGRFHMESKGDMYSLLVSCATPKDSGLYVCRAKNSIGETYAATMLRVEPAEPREEGGCSGSVAPAFLIAPSSLRVCRGEDVMFTCRVSGQPCPVLEWEKDGHKLSELFESSHFAVGQKPEDWHFLKLFSARPQDGGVYVCRARSGSQEALAAAVLLVEPQALPGGLPNGSPADGPEALAERVPGAKAFAVSAGKHAKFRCYVTGKPKPEIIWQKDGEPLAPGRRHLIYEDREGYFILKVLYCKPQDQGLYMCTASNTAGQTLSAVQLQVKEHRLRFQVQLADVEVAEREDAVLECQVPLETIPTSWYLEDRELQPSHKYVMEEQGVVRRLTIRDARIDDDGIYLCQMKDKGRSIAEVSVRGVIAKRLPRKLDVMEGENAVFCVETRDVVEGSCWSRDGLQLRESPRTVLKSFGRTHLLVLVHVTRQDAGIISFTVGESQTSSQLRVKCVKHDPPSAPVAAEMSVVETNTALLTWCPAPDSHLRPASHYLLERREAAGEEWVQCLATDLPSCVRVLGDSVPREADYCFRISAANKHGRSSPVEFPGSVHLAPAARLERGLQDVWVRDGEDAQFSLELSAAVHGSWFLNGARLAEEEDVGGRCSVQRHGMEHSLLIRGVRLVDSGAQVTFVSGGLRDSAILHVQGPQQQGLSCWRTLLTTPQCLSAPQVRIAPVPEAERLRKVPAGMPVLLECQVSTPDAPVCWLKDGKAVPLDDIIAVQAEGCMRRLLLRSACPSDTGVYTCDTGDDAVTFVVTVTGEIISSNEELWCQLSRPAAPVHWYKDGEEVEVGESLVLEQEGPRCKLVLPCAQTQDTGEFVCDAVFYTVTVAEPPVRILQPCRPVPVMTVSPGETVTLCCELSRADTPVCWAKEGVRLEAGGSLVLEEEGVHRRLLIPAAQDAGEYLCDTGDDSIVFFITVEGEQEVLDLVLACELSRPDAIVRWLRNGQEVHPGERVQVEARGVLRQLTITGAQPTDAGCYICDAASDRMVTNVEPVYIVNKEEAQSPLEVQEGDSVTLVARLSPETAAVQWQKDGQTLCSGGRLLVCSEGPTRSLTIKQAELGDGGIFLCDAAEPSAPPAEAPVLFVNKREEQEKLLVLEGGSAVLSLCKARGDVVWRKDGRVLAPGPRRQMTAEGRERSLVLSRVEPGDAGEYCCESNDDQTLATLTVVVEIIMELQNLTVLEGEEATFKCLVSPEDVAVTWQLNGQPVVSSERLLVTRSGLCHSLTLRQCQTGDAGTVTANAEGLVSTARLSVQEAQVLFVRKLQDVVAEEQGDVCLEVEVSHEAAEVQWLKQGILLQPGSKYLLQESGCRRTLTICSLGPADRGTYRCESLHDRTQAKLHVEREYQVSIRTPLADVETFEKETATFHLELSHPGVTGVWTRDGIRVKPSSTCRISATGCGHSLTLERLALEDSGTVTFTADTLRCSAHLHVREPPVTMVRVPRDLGVPETGVASFECELSRPNAEVKWFKDGQELRPGPNCRIYSAGRRRILQLSRCELTDTGSYTCDAGDCRASAMLHVQGTVTQLSECLQDVQVREGDNAVFTCEVSHGDVKGEWFRDGEKIKVSSTVKIRQEGTRHFLLFCGVRPEDKGLIRFTARTVISEASLQVEALPIRIVKPLRDKTVLARHKATLECTVSHARGRVRWLRGDTEIFAGDKYEICNLDCYRTLIIHRVGPEDEDSYTCDAFDDRSTARLLVEGEWAPRGAPLAAASAAVPCSKGTPKPVSLSPIACKSLSAGLEGAG
uniref:Obscurin like cytoskeletal adaptor 1 n=1 Tax=Serinus canaria TaxID=9135 RepID=A0A8C9UGI6_SERCA